MTAVMLYTSSPISSIVPYLLMLTIVPICLAFAPQPIRGDKRVKVGVILLVIFGISAPALAFPTYICDIAPWIFECWFR
jgi:hypothetical protein